MGDNVFRPSEAIPFWEEFYYRHDPDGKNVPLTLGKLFEWIHSDIDMMKNIIDHYERFNKTSYVKIDNVTTVSKLKIKLPINEFDPIGSTIISEYYMKNIEIELMKYLMSQSITIK